MIVSAESLNKLLKSLEGDFYSRNSCFCVLWWNQVPEIWDRIMKTYEGQWVKIAQKQNQLYFNASNGNLRHLANRFVHGVRHWVNLYSTYQINLLKE